MLERGEMDQVIYFQIFFFYFAEGKEADGVHLPFVGHKSGCLEIPGLQIFKNTVDIEIKQSSRVSGIQKTFGGTSSCDPHSRS